MQVDNPHVRAALECPLCYGPKNEGLVTCWHCYHRHGLKYGNETAEHVIASRERFLASEAVILRKPLGKVS